MDLILRNGRLRGREEPIDIGILDGRIAALEPNLQAKGVREIPLDGRLASPPFCDPHVHLDAVLTAGNPRHNQSGTLLEGIQIWSERKRELTFEDVYERALHAVKWAVSQGTLFIRTHVDVCDEKLTALHALLKLRSDLKDFAEIQIVSFPQEGVLSFPRGAELVEQSLKLGADCVGGIPHYEWTREDGVRELEIVFELAEKYGRAIDIHCDETDDEQSRFLEHVCALSMRSGMEGRVAAGHATAMHSYNNAYAFKLIRILARAGVSIIANPLDNAILQGRFDTYPKRRGLTRVKELLAAGVNVGLGHDSIMDPWYPLGKGSMLQAAFVLLHMCQMSGRDEQSAVFDMITSNNARAMGIEDYGLEVDRRADLIVLEARDEFDVLRILPPALWAIKGGRIVAETKPSQTRVHRNGLDELLDFNTPA